MYRVWPSYTRDALYTKQFLCALQLTKPSKSSFHSSKLFGAAPRESHEHLSKNPQDPLSIMPRVLLWLFELEFFFHFVFWVV